jgi:hypothetical protein
MSAKRSADPGFQVEIREWGVRLTSGFVTRDRIVAVALEMREKMAEINAKERATAEKYRRVAEQVANAD